MGSKGYTLYGFNNLTKTLSFNIYDICYAHTEEDRKSYLNYIDRHYNSNRLTEILRNIVNTIDANILNIAKQDYYPQGASVTMLISEEELPLYIIDKSCNRGFMSPLPSHVVGHLDKSHVTVHTYPESHPGHGISTFRVDIDVSTCGQISPLKALNKLIASFDSDIITVDYRVRGFTRCSDGKKLFIDHPINSIQDYIEQDIKSNYHMLDVNVFQENIFHTKMILKDFKLEDYVFNIDIDKLSDEEQAKITELIKREMYEIFYGRNYGQSK